MQFLTLVKPGPMPPPPEAVRASRAWIDAKLADGTFECCYAFVDGGGFSVGKADSFEALMEDLIDYPMAPWVEYDVRAIVPVGPAMDRYIAFVDRMAAGASG